MNHYRNFIIELADHDPNKDGRERMSVFVRESPGGRHHDQSDVEVIEFPDRLRDRLRALERRQSSIEDLIALGEDLAEILLPRTHRGGYSRSVRKLFHLSRFKLQPDQGLRIQIRTRSADLAQLPWEYVYVTDPDRAPGRKGREGFLALDRTISIVRYENFDAPEQAESRKQAELRVLAMLSEVRQGGWAELDLDQDEANLLQAMEGVDEVDLTILRPGTLEQFNEYLSSSDESVPGDFEVFHFSGHGDFERWMGERPGETEGQGRLILCGDDGEPVPLDADKLAADLNGRGIRLAVLGACDAARRDATTPWSGVASALLQKGVPAVVAMQYTIRDGNAVAFARRLYQALAAGKSIDAAVSDGRLGINQRAGSSERDWGVPVLYLGTDDTRLFPQPRGPVVRNFILAAFAFAVFSVWFALHVWPPFAHWYEDVTGTLGLTVGALALLGILGKWLYGQFMKVWTWGDLPIMGWLRGPRTHVPLVGLCLASLALFFSTYTVRLTQTELDDQPAAVEIAIFEADEDGTMKNEDGTKKKWAKIQSLSTTKDDRLDGDLAFVPWPNRIEVELVNPPFWDLRVDTLGGQAIGNPVTVQPRPWRPITIQVSQPTWKIVHLIADRGLSRLLRRRNANYKLTVTVDGEETVLYQPWSGSPVYLGAPEHVLIDRAQGHEWDDEKRECAGGVPEDKYPSAWIKKSYTRGPRWKPGKTMDVAVVDLGAEGGPKVMAEDSIEFPANAVQSKKPETKCLKLK